MPPVPIRLAGLLVALILSLAIPPQPAAGGGPAARRPSASDPAARQPERGTGTAHRPLSRSDGTPLGDPPARVALPAPAAAKPAAPATGTVAGPTHRVATRVAIPALGIDLPVIRQRTRYPPCNVAMYLTRLRQPGQGGATYLYAHARRGMFLPLLQRSQVGGGASLLGMRVEVYTGDNRRFVYRIDQVRRHARDLSAVFGRRGEVLWLQTSEGPRGTIPKLQLAARLVATSTVSHAAAHPKPRPVNCG